MRKTKILFIFGTRPEAIKIVPLTRAFESYNSKFEVRVCVTAQHREMLDQVLTFFDIKPDYDLNLMKENQTLFDITSNGLNGVEEVLDNYSPDFIFVQGDTTTAFVGALSGFYRKIKVVHIEAGLRSGNKYSPYPEETNRALIDHIANYHFAPTQKARQNLFSEGIKENVYVVGNTSVDALFWVLDIIKNNKIEEKRISDYFSNIIPNFGGMLNSKIILVTAHRRESFGEGFINICKALREIAKRDKDINIIYPVHLNPNVREPVYKSLKGIKNIHLIKPLNYPHLVWLMNKSYLILTDSGGIQEEAPSLGKPVLVMRNVTERTEGIKVGTAKLVKTDKSRIIEETENLLYNENEYREMAKVANPYGDGKAAEKIVKVILQEIKEE